MKNLCFLFLVPFCLKSQTQQNKSLYGRIVDSTYKPIDYASIEVIASDTRRMTRSGDSGDFSISNLTSDSVKLIVRHMGYQTIDTSFVLERADSTFIILKLQTDRKPTALWVGFGKARARYDIKNKEIRILLSGGMVLHLEPEDKMFESRYNLHFYNQCVEISGESMSAYNKEMFKFLDKKYGKQWRKEIRQDVIGLK